MEGREGKDRAGEGRERKGKNDLKHPVANSWLRHCNTSKLYKTAQTLYWKGQQGLSIALTTARNKKKEHKCSNVAYKLTI